MRPLILIHLDDNNGRYIVEQAGKPFGVSYAFALDKATKVRGELLAAGLDVEAVNADAAGSYEGFEDYARLCAEAEAYHAVTGLELACMLSPQLIGLEGKWVWAGSSDATARRFCVSKRGRAVPVHIEAKAPGGRFGPRVKGLYKVLTVLS